MAFGPVNVPAYNKEVVDQGKLEDQLGSPGGVATLDEEGKLPKEQLPDIDFDMLGLPRDFNNLLHWPDCTRITDPPVGTTGEIVERIVDRATKSILKAKRTTLKNSDNDYTETYIYYNDDGVTEKYKYIVQTTKDGGTSAWFETVTKEEVSK